MLGSGAGSLKFGRSNAGGRCFRFAAVDPPSPAAVRQLPRVGLVRLDVANLDAAAVAARVAPFLDAGMQIHAVGVESLDVFQACVAAGCTGFQGTFRALPEKDLNAQADYREHLAQVLTRRAVSVAAGL